MARATSRLVKKTTAKKAPKAAEAHDHDHKDEKPSA
jgi:hypothetical protein